MGERMAPSFGDSNIEPQNSIIEIKGKNISSKKKNYQSLKRYETVHYIFQNMFYLSDKLCMHLDMFFLPSQL